MASLKRRFFDPVRHRRSWRSAQGSELVEMAMVLPLLLALVGGVMDFAFMFQRWEIVTNAAREGARIRVLPGYNNPDAIARANAYLTAAGLTPNGTVTVTQTTIPPGGAGASAFPAYVVTVPYTHTFEIIGPLLDWIPGGSALTSVTLTGRSTMRSELAAAPPAP